jgi:hypothetical protein
LILYGMSRDCKRYFPKISEMRSLLGSPGFSGGAALPRRAIA